MIIKSAVLGEVEVDNNSIFALPNGLLGFDESAKYALVERREDDVTLRWFQSVDSPVPCFVVFDPFEIINGYDPQLELSDLKALKATRLDDLVFLVIAVVPDDISKITVNLKSPIVLNVKENIARQVILQNEDYPIRFPLMVQLEEDSSNASVEKVNSNC